MLLVLVLLLFSTTKVEALLLNNNLTEHLLKTYLRVRPVRHPGDKIEIHVQSALYQVVDLDQSNNLASIAAYFDLWWFDVNLFWDPADFNGTLETYLPTSAVWIPEIYLYHSVQGSAPLSLKDSAVQIDYHGKVRIFVPFTARAFCPVNVKYFPFDTQTCSFKFGSWSYKSQSMEYIVESNDVFLGDFYDNQEWLLIDSSLSNGLSEYSTKNHNETYAMVILELVLQRQSFYYVFNLVIPSTLVSLVSVIGLHAPSSSAFPPRRENKFRLGIMTLLSMGVMLLMLVEEMPKFARKSIQGQRGSFSSVPLLGLYYISLITIVSVATISYTIFVYLERYGMEHRDRQSIPLIIRWLDTRQYSRCSTDIYEDYEEKEYFFDNSTNCHQFEFIKVPENCRQEQIANNMPALIAEKLERICSCLRQQLKAQKRAMYKTRLPVHWNIVISRLENFSLFFYLGLISTVIFLFQYTDWY